MAKPNPLSSKKPSRAAHLLAWLTSPSRVITRREFAFIVGFWLMVTPVWIVAVYTRWQITKHYFSIAFATGFSLTDASAWAIITLSALVVARQHPVEWERGRWLRTVPLHLLLGLLLVTARGWVLQSMLLSVARFPNEFHLGLRVLLGISSDFVVWLMLLAAAYGHEYFRRYRERELASIALEHQLTLAQLQMLKMQLQPHFLFNTLNGISSLVRHDAERAERMIADLSDMLRTTLTHQQTQEVTLNEELTTLDPYISIEKARFGERLTIDLRIDPDVMGACVPHLLLQPLVENAIRHGVAPRKRPGRVEVSASRENGTLRLVVADNGCGITGPLRQGAIGLANTQARLEQLYGSEMSFRIQSTPEQGTRVEITLPLRIAHPGHLKRA